MNWWDCKLTFPLIWSENEPNKRRPQCREHSNLRLHICKSHPKSRILLHIAPGLVALGETMKPRVGWLGCNAAARIYAYDDFRERPSFPSGFGMPWTRRIAQLGIPGLARLILFFCILFCCEASDKDVCVYRGPACHVRPTSVTFENSNRQPFIYGQMSYWIPGSRAGSST